MLHQRTAEQCEHPISVKANKYLLHSRTHMAIVERYTAGQWPSGYCRRTYSQVWAQIIFRHHLCSRAHVLQLIKTHCQKSHKGWPIRTGNTWQDAQSSDHHRRSMHTHSHVISCPSLGLPLDDPLSDHNQWRMLKYRASRQMLRCHASSGAGFTKHRKLSQQFLNKRHIIKQVYRMTSNGLKTWCVKSNLCIPNI